MFIIKNLIFTLSYPLVLFLDLLSIFIKFKFSEINVSRLGHATIYVEGFISYKKFLIKNEFKNTKIIFYFSKPIVNHQVTKMIKRVLPIYRPSIFFYFLSRVLIFWKRNKYILKFNYSIKNPEVLNQFSKIYKKPNLYFLDKEIFKAKKLLINFGIKEKDKWICIHNRDSAFLEKKFPKKNWSYHSFRDFSANDLTNAANYFAEKGFYVFRMGSVQKERLNSTKSKVIDYAFSNLRCDLLDIYLLAKCEFYFGGESGPSDIAFSFKKPCYGINFPPTYLYMSRPHLPWIFIFKRIMDIRTNQLLTLRETFFNKLDGINDSDFLKKKKYKLIDNSSESILEFAIEVLKDYSGNLSEDSDDISNQKKFWDIYYQHNSDNRGFEIHPKISPNFLRKNIDLIS